MEGAVRLGAEVDGRPLDGVRRLQKRRLVRDVRVFGEQHLRLHVRVGLVEEEVAQHDADQEEAGAYQVGEEVWVRGEEAAGGKGVGEGLVGVAKVPPMAGPMMVPIDQTKGMME